jgi:hypothetical protein
MTILTLPERKPYDRHSLTRETTRRFTETAHRSTICLSHPARSARICQAFDLNPLTTIASSALPLGGRAADALSIYHALEVEGITCMDIGWVGAGSAWHGTDPRKRI